MIRKLSKYRAKPTVVDNIRFASKKEAQRYQELKLRERAREIRNLEIQPTFTLSVRGVTIGTYRGDFRYLERGDLFTKGDRAAEFDVVEDVKSPATRTPLYRWKVKHLLAEWGIAVRET